MPSRSATYSIAFCDVQPPACSCARHNSGITAEACRPSGYFAICCLAQARFSAVKENSFGWTSAGARRRTDIWYPCGLEASLHRLAVARGDGRRVRRLGHEAEVELLLLLQIYAPAAAARRGRSDHSEFLR